VSRELKLALVVGFCVVMVVAVLVSDHLSKANKAQLATGSDAVPTVIAANMPEKPLPGLDDYLPKGGIPGAVSTDPVESVPSLTSGDPKSELKIEQPRIDLPGQSPASTNAAPKGASLPAQGQTDTVTPGSGQPTKSIGSLPLPPESTISKPAADATSKLENKVEPKKTETTQLPTRTGPVAGEKSHTIGEGDTLFKICKKYYGDGNLWKQLASYNSGKLGKDGTLKTNAVLAIPPREVLTGKTAPKPADVKAVKPKTELAAKPEPKADDKAKTKSKVTTYTIKPGDTIGVISRKLLGTSKRSQEIIDLNASSPSFSEDELTPGMVIKVPAA
jgi:nucleoid-associated protein YgaU